MAVQTLPRCWNVKNFVRNVEQHRGNPRIQESYRRINLTATLMWGLTQTERLRTCTVEEILDHMLTETADLAYDNGFFLCYEDYAAFTTAAEELLGFSQVSFLTIEHLFCKDCTPPFPWETLRARFAVMRDAGLRFGFLKRTRLEPIHLVQRVMDDFLRVYGGLTTAEMYDTSRPADFTMRDYVVLKMAKRFEIFATDPNDLACHYNQCVPQEYKWCSMGMSGCTWNSDPYTEP